MLPPYSPETYSDFTDPASATQYEVGLEIVRSRLGDRALLVIGGEELDTKPSIESLDPSEPSRVVGSSASASSDQVNDAIDAAWVGYADW